MTQIIYPPLPGPVSSPIQVDVFLAGSIEMGIAELWQDPLAQSLTELECIGNIYNPRRADFDASQKQSIDNEYFSGQVNWELNSIESADVVFMYLDPNTKSPISLMELGYILGSLPQYNNTVKKQVLIVCCPDGFWRQGNVEIMMTRGNIKMYRDYNEAITDLKSAIWTKHRLLANYYNYAPFKAPFECQRETELFTGLRGQKIPKDLKLD